MEDISKNLISIMVRLFNGGVFSLKALMNEEEERIRAEGKSKKEPVRKEIFDTSLPEGEAAYIDFVKRLDDDGLQRGVDYIIKAIGQQVEVCILKPKE